MLEERFCLAATSALSRSALPGFLSFRRKWLVSLSGLPILPPALLKLPKVCFQPAGSFNCPSALTEGFHSGSLLWPGFSPLGFTHS
jgi:hypothetical protein